MNPLPTLLVAILLEGLFKIEVVMGHLGKGACFHANFFAIFLMVS